MPSISLEEIVNGFALGVKQADAQQPVCKTYLPGIGPHEEPQTIQLVMAQIADLSPALFADYSIGVPYPDSPRQKCDPVIGPVPDAWHIEVKMARFKGNNGKDADGTVKLLISPYPRDHSALTDCTKLAMSSFIGRKAVLIYGFDFEDRSLDPVIEAFELLANARVRMGLRHSSEFNDLVHPVHRRGRVFGWEIFAD